MQTCAVVYTIIIMLCYLLCTDMESEMVCFAKCLPQLFQNKAGTTKSCSLY